MALINNGLPFNFRVVGDPTGPTGHPWTTPGRRGDQGIPTFNGRGIPATVGATFWRVPQSGNVTGSGAVTLDPLTESASGAHGVSGSAARTLGALTSAASGTFLPTVTGTAARTLDALTAAATGAFIVEAAGAVTLATLTRSAAGAHGVAGTAARTLGALTSTASGYLPVEGTADATLADATGASSGSHLFGSAAATLGALTGAATGVIDSPPTGTAAVTLGALTGAAQAFLQVSGTAVATLGELIGAAGAPDAPESPTEALGAPPSLRSGAGSVVRVSSDVVGITPSRVSASNSVVARSFVSNYPAVRAVSGNVIAMVSFGPPMAILYGTRARIRVNFTDPVTGAALDPIGVKLTVQPPNAVATSYRYGGGADIVKDDTGKYHLDLLCSFVGTVRYRWDSTGNGEEAADEGSFSVTTPAVS